MATIEIPTPNNSDVRNLLSEEGKELLARQERLQASRIEAINRGDGYRRRLIEEELDEIAEKLK